MKKSTIYLVAGTLVLALVAFLMTRKTEKAPPKKLDIAGYAKPEELEAEKNRSMFDSGDPIAHPVDEVLLERADGRIRLVRDSANKEQKWKISEPIDGLAVDYLVEQIVELFKSPTTRSDARVIKAADFAQFDFEPARRIGLTLKSAGAVWNGVDLIVGQVVKGDGDRAIKGTWVMVRGDETTAYLLAEKDLRTPVSKDLSELRNKKVFAMAADNISRIEVSPPDAAKVVLVGETKETPPPEGSAPDAKPTKTTTWTLAEPALKGDSSIGSVASSLSSLLVKEFVPLDKATEAARKSLEGPACKVSFKVGEQVTTLKIAVAGEGDTWAQVEGRNELMGLSGFSAQGLCKGIEELKDKTALSVDQGAITELTLKGDVGPITIAKDGSSWRFVSPSLPWAADPGGILGSAARVTAQRWARPDEFGNARTALATPDISVIIKAGAEIYNLTISAPVAAAEGESTTRWAALGDPTTAEPFVIPDQAAKRFVTTVAGLREKKLLPGIKDTLAGLTLTPAGTTESIVLEKPSTGGELTFVPTLPNKVSNDETIRSLVATLSNLEAKEFHDGKDVATTGLSKEKSTRLGLRLNDGRSFDLLISATTAGEGTVYAMATGGPLANVPLAINEYQAKNLQKGSADFQKDATPAGPAPGQ